MTTPMSEDEVRTFARKVAAWVETLEPSEQAAIGEIFRRGHRGRGERRGGGRLRVWRQSGRCALASAFSALPVIGGIAATVYVIARDLQAR